MKGKWLLKNQIEFPSEEAKQLVEAYIFRDPCCSLISLSKSLLLILK